MERLRRAWNLWSHGHEYFLGYVWGYTSPLFLEATEENSFYLRIVQDGHCDHVTTMCLAEGCLAGHMRRFARLDFTQSRAGKKYLALIKQQDWYPRWKYYFEDL